MRNSVATKNCFNCTMLILALLLFVALPNSAEAIHRAYNGGYSNPGLPNMTSNSHTNQYELRIINNRRLERDYQRRLAAYNQQIERQRLEQAKRSRQAAAQLREKQLREQRAHELQLAKINAQGRVAKNKSVNGKINYARQAKQEPSIAANGQSNPQVRNNNEPENPSVIQRLRYAFTGRY